jgi:molybdate transport system ATP-binding protein
VANLQLDIGVDLRSFALGVGLSVGPETVALVGPSGAGKTTVLRSVAGLRRPDRGRITVGERTWFDAGARVHLQPEERSVGMLFQEYALFPHMSVRANVAFGGAARVDELLERFRISHLAGQRPGAISGGERQRVALARALARGPEVLLLDEPLSALDAHTRAVVRAELGEVLAGLELPVLLVTHDLRDATALADRVGVVVEGGLRQLATPAELVRAPADAVVARLIGANVVAADLVRAWGGTVPDGAGEVILQPWELTIGAGAPPPGVAALPGVVTGLEPEGDRVRVRLGDVVVLCAPGEAERLGLARGVLAHAVLPAGPLRGTVGA